LSRLLASAADGVGLCYDALLLGEGLAWGSFSL
jgi:hypothetical protein